MARVVQRPGTVSGLFGDLTPTGQLGIGFSCRECGTRIDEETGEEVWFFSGSLEVTAVNRDGPADEVGIVRGDLIKAIEGHAIETDEGGRAFTDITFGQEVRLTVVRRSGREVEVVVVPEEVAPTPLRRTRGAAPRPPDTAAVAGVAVVATPPSRAFEGRANVARGNVAVARPVTIPFADVPVTGAASATCGHATALDRHPGRGRGGGSG